MKSTKIMLDDTDRAIIGTMTENVRVPITTLADLLNMSPARVTARLQELLQLKVVQFTAQRNLRYYGLDTLCVIRVTLAPDASQATIDAICAMPNAFIVVEMLGTPQLLMLCAFPSLATVRSVVEGSFADMPGIRQVNCQIVLRVLKYASELTASGAFQAHDPIEIDRTSVDEQIIDLLQADGRSSNTEIARVIGLSESAVRQRLARMAQEKRLRFGIIVEQSVFNADSVFLSIAAEPHAVVRIATALSEVATLCYLVSGTNQVIGFLQGNDPARLFQMAAEVVERQPGVLNVSYQSFFRSLKHNMGSYVATD